MELSGMQGTVSPLQNGIAGKGNAALGKDEFLKLLITQLQYQDPLNPMEGTEFATQLAQFNSVEQLINLNDGVNGLANAQNVMSAGLNNSLASSLTGKTARVLSNTIYTDGNSEQVIHLRLRDLATETEIIVRDANGNAIRTETLSNLGRGDHSWTWDGKSDAGMRAPEGEYSIEVASTNGDDNVNTLTFIEGLVEKVRFTSQGVELLVNGVRLPLGDVEEIGI
jgi:flagellar basal-body rod modification protein FlgD